MHPGLLPPRQRVVELGDPEGAYAILAETLAENQERTVKDNETLASQLAEVRNQLKMAELLGYGTKKSFKPMYEEIKQIEQQTAGGKGGKGWFDKIKQQLSDLI